MELYSVQFILGKAEITGDKGMYPRASGGPDPRLISRDYYILQYILFHIMDRPWNFG